MRHHITVPLVILAGLWLSDSRAVHNVGSASAGDVLVAVMDGNGRAIARKSIGALDAPTDLLPRRIQFTLPVPDRPQAGWRLVLDPDNEVPEIYEGNNEVDLAVIQTE